MEKGWGKNSAKNLVLLKLLYIWWVKKQEKMIEILTFPFNLS